MIRQPVVAGRFYPGSKSALEKTLKEMIPGGVAKSKALGLVSPHAGYVYSGACAGKGFARVELTETVVILGVNHRGGGAALAVDNHEQWKTPLGTVDVDLELANLLARDSSYFSIDNRAGLEEHSLEVQVPFIQYLSLKSKILPVTISLMDRQALMLAGKELGALIRKYPRCMMVASTDMSHYISAKSAEKKDKLAIDRIVALDPSGLFDVVSQNQISMCGVAPTVLMLTAAKELGASSAQVVEYTNSGVVSGDDEQVVGYVSIVVQ